MDVQHLKMVVIVLAALFLATSSGYDTVSGKASDELNNLKSLRRSDTFVLCIRRWNQRLRALAVNVK